MQRDRAPAGVAGYGHVYRRAGAGTETRAVDAVDGIGAVLLQPQRLDVARRWCS